jgi:hypothetical protein
MLKHTFLSILLLIPLCSYADVPSDKIADDVCLTDSLTADSISSIDLQEFVVEAPKVIRKADMDVYYPSESAVDHSKNGMQLLQNLMIPSVTVNELLGTVNSSGESVQVRINGREATVEQVKSLLPESIKRVEWLDNPGLRYKDAKAVLNFVVVNPTLGGSLYADGMQSLNSPWGDYNANLKLNNGRSQWGVNAEYKLTNRLGAYREYSETFIFENDDQLTRNETPKDGYMSNNYGSLQIDYSYVKPDTTTLWVALRGYDDIKTESMFDGVMTQSNGTGNIHLRDRSGNNGFTPSLQAYLEQHFKNNQLIAVDFTAKLYTGKTYRYYTETDDATSDLLNDVNTSIRDRNLAYAVSADYIKSWKNSELTAGVAYSANRNRSVYDNLDGEVFHQRQDQVYFFGEYFQRIKKVTLTAGIGGQYTDFRFTETGEGSSSWNVRPRFSATYTPNSVSQFRLNFATWQTTPSLSETNIAPVQSDGIQWTIGNPNLKTSTSYSLSLRYSLNVPHLYSVFGVTAFSSPDAITPYLYWENDRLITSYENSNGLQNLNFYISPQIEIIPNWLSLSGTLSYRIERMKGRDYKLYNRNWSGDATLMAQHWGFYMIAQYNKAKKELWGEQYSWGESISLLALGYQWKNWEFMAGLICPFTKYDSGFRSVSKYNTNLQHSRLDMSPLPIVQIKYNLQWGRQKRGIEKMVDADASVSTSSAGGR